MPWNAIEKISGVTKAVIALIVVIGSGFLAYNKIFSNEAQILEIKKKEERDKEFLQKTIREGEMNLEKELSLQSNRADKRYSRALKIAKDHEERLRDLERRITYIEGKEGY